MKKNEMINITIVREFIDEGFKLVCNVKHDYDMSKEIERLFGISGHTLKLLNDFISVHGESCKMYDSEVCEIMREFFCDINRLNISVRISKSVIENNKKNVMFMAMVKKYHIRNHELIKIDE